MGAGSLSPLLPDLSRAGTPWTDTERATLRTLWADSAWPRFEVARTLRRPLGGVIQEAKRLNLGRKA
jgi:hypothetical protein